MSVRDEKNLATGIAKLCKKALKKQTSSCYNVSSMEKIKRSALQLCKWINSHRVGIVFFAFIFIALALLPQITFAQDIESMLSGKLDYLFEAILGMLARMLATLLSVVGKLIVMILGALIIPILGYNNFGDSAIIDIGWPLVRDVVNMFVIVVLLVIAIQTIIGYSKAQWEAQLPRFFIAIVLVNFSRTISLIMIDVSQVVMFTFVNALRDIAAGNFVNLFQLNDFIIMGGTDVGEVAIESYRMFAEFFVTLGLLLTVLGTLIILAIVYIYRIVILWVLVILSPIAFFMGGVGKLFSEAAGKYSQWWKMMTGALTLGPILTFFLWLALAAASAGPIAESEGMNFEGTEDIPTLFAQIFLSEKLVSLAIALVLIMAGFKVASEAAQAMGNVAAKLVTEDTGKRLVKNALTMPASTAYRAGRGATRMGWRAGKTVAGAGYAAGKYGAVQAARQIESRTDTGQGGIGQQVGRGITDIGSQLSREGAIGRMVGSRVMGLGGRMEAGAAASVDAARSQARTDVEGMTMAERAGHLGAVQRDAEGNIQAPPLQRDRHRQEELLMDFATNKAFQKQMKEQMDEGQYEQMMSTAHQFAKDNESRMTENQQKAFKQAKAARLRDEVVRNDDGTIDEEATRRAIEGVVNDSDFRMNQLSADDMEDEAVRNAMRSVERTYIDNAGNEQTETMMDRIQREKGVSQDVRQRARGVEREARAEAAYAANDGQAIAQAIRNGDINAATITADQIADDVARNIAEGIARADVDLSGLSDDVRAALAPAFEELSGGAGSVADKARFDGARLRLGANPEDVINVGADGNMNNASQETMRVAAQGNPSIVMNFQNHIQNAVNNEEPNDVTRSMTESFTRADIDGLMSRFNEAQTNEAREEVRGILDQMRAAVSAEGFREEAERRVSTRDLTNLGRQMDLARRQM